MNGAPIRFVGTIDIGDPNAVAYWSRELGLTPNQLRRAVKQVGTDAAALARYLGKRGPIRMDSRPPSVQ